LLQILTEDLSDRQICNQESYYADEIGVFGFGMNQALLGQECSYIISGIKSATDVKVGIPSPYERP
jgi:hypothetical protein